MHRGAKELSGSGRLSANFIARLATPHPTIYVMVADTLAEVQAMVPPGLKRSAWAMTDPPEVVEIWFGPEA